MTNIEEQYTRKLTRIDQRLQDYIENARERTGQIFEVEERYTTNYHQYHRALIVSNDGERRRMYYDAPNRRWRIA